MKKFLFLLLCSFTAYAQPTINQAQDLTLCDPSGAGYGLFDLTLNTNTVLGNLDPNLYTITYHLTETNAESGLMAIEAPQTFFNMNVYGQIIYIRVTENANIENYAITSFDIILLNTPQVQDISDMYFYDYNGDGVVTINLDIIKWELFPDEASAEGLEVTYYTTISNAEEGINPVQDPENFALQYVRIYYRVENILSGCYVVEMVSLSAIPAQSDVPEPYGETTQTFTQGQTLADLEVIGQNIQWHSTNNSDDLLLETTVLEDGTTYYASQTIDNVQSAARLAVTGSLTMSLNKNTFGNLTAYPNPVASTLHLKNYSAIDAVEIHNALGQLIVTKTFNDTEVKLDMSGFTKGIYFVNVKSNDALKTIKIVKQ